MGFEEVDVEDLHLGAAQPLAVLLVLRLDRLARYRTGHWDDQVGYCSFCRDGGMEKLMGWMQRHSAAKSRVLYLVSGAGMAVEQAIAIEIQAQNPMVSSGGGRDGGICSSFDPWRETVGCWWVVEMIVVGDIISHELYARRVLARKLEKWFQDSPCRLEETIRL